VRDIGVVSRQTPRLASRAPRIYYARPVLGVGDRIPAATVFLGPREPVSTHELVEDGPKLLLFYLFDWSST
jgi:hypothetical protein